METIKLQQVLPAVFADTPPAGSEVWMCEAVFEKGKRYLIEADSGTGKTSLCAYLYGYRSDYSGNILFDSGDIGRLSVKEWSSLRMTSLAMLFQDLRLFPELNVSENIALKNNLTEFRTGNEIKALLEELGIGDKQEAPAGKLSFGQQQRAAFVRTLCQPFDFIVLDEPVSHLDDSNSGKMAGILLREAAKQGAGIITTSIGKRLEMDYDKIIRL